MKVIRFSISLFILIFWLAGGTTFANGELIATVDFDGTTTTVYHAHTDHLTGTGVITSSTPTEIQTLDYFPFGGVRLNDKAGSFDEKRQYAGSEFDSDTGLNYMNARYYSSGVGRFVSQDQLFHDIGIDEGLFKQKYGRTINNVLFSPQILNSYSYVSNNPIIKYDPSGEAEIYVRGPWQGSHWYEKFGHVLIKVNGTYYGFGPTDEPMHDVQQFSDADFQRIYNGQTWTSFDIGTEYDVSIKSQFEALKTIGDIKEGTYKFYTNNCTTKAYDILENAGAFEGGIAGITGIDRSTTPMGLSYNLRMLYAREKAYNLFVDGSYDPLVNSISTVKIQKEEEK